MSKILILWKGTVKRLRKCTSSGIRGNGFTPCFSVINHKCWPGDFISLNCHVQTGVGDHLPTYYSVFGGFFSLSGLIFVFVFLYDLELSCQTKGKNWLRFDGSCIEYIYLFGEDLHLYAVSGKSPNSCT